MHVHEGHLPRLKGGAVVCKDLFLVVDVLVETFLQAVHDDHLHEWSVRVVPRHEVADELVIE